MKAIRPLRVFYTVVDVEDPQPALTRHRWLRTALARTAKAIFQAACQKLARNMIYQGMRKRLRGGTGKEGTCNSDRKICCVVYAEGQIDDELIF